MSKRCWIWLNAVRFWSSACRQYVLIQVNQRQHVFILSKFKSANWPDYGYLRCGNELEVVVFVMTGIPHLSSRLFLEASTQPRLFMQQSSSANRSLALRW